MLLHECIELKGTDLNITLFHLIYTFNVTKITFYYGKTDCNLKTRYSNTLNIDNV